jgi:aminoglycoside/choline kinase family phosphotransferase
MSLSANSLSPVTRADTPASPYAVTWSDPQREAAFHAWLDAVAPAHGLLPGTLRPASADASFRRYLRLDGASAAGAAPSFIVMDAPPDKEDCKPFAHVAGLMAAAGLPVPQILAWDVAHGFMLLSDLGAHTMMAVIQAETPPEYKTSLEAGFWPRPAPSAAVEAMYHQAIDLLIAWQLASRPAVLPLYDSALLQRELALFPDWYLARHRGIAIDDPAWKVQRETLAQAFALIVQNNLAAPQVYVHRDFMPRNLMVNTEATGASGADARQAPVVALGVLDFQDAVFGPVTYDIASLMRDAFLTWDESFVLDITVRYWQKARRVGLLDHEGWSDNFGDFYRSVEWMGLQRHLKVAGIFARLSLRDGKPQYLADTPRFIGYIRSTAARYHELKPLLRLIDTAENITPGVGYAFGRVA